MKYLLLLILCLTTIKITLIAQQDIYREIIDDPRIIVPLEDKKFGQPHRTTFKSASSNVVTIQVNTHDGLNIIGDAANEPSLGVDPNNPNRMVIGWRQFETIESNFRQAGIAFTEDGGLTWTNLPPIEEDVFRSDPVIDTDSDGNFYYNSLKIIQSPFSANCDVFKSYDLIDWSDKTYAYGGDKQWMVIDKTENETNGQTYAFWVPNDPVCMGSFTRSMNFEDGYDECSSMPAVLRRGSVTLDPLGDIYAFGSVYNKFRILKSSNAKIPGEEVHWEQNLEVDMEGETSLYQGPNPAGLLGQAWITSDHSETETRGNIYVLATIDKNEVFEHADIVFSRSLDGGSSWSDPITINDDIGNNWNWFGTISVAPNGRIDVTWVDTRDHAEDFRSSLYYSYSIDGGVSWSENEKLSEGFDPLVGHPNQEKIGDYYHSISTNEGVHLAWAATFNGEQDVLYSFITPEGIVSATDELNLLANAKVFPNPTTDNFEIQLNNHIEESLSITILNLSGQEINKTKSFNLSNDQKSITLNSKDFAISNEGLYFIKLSTKSGTTQLLKLIIN